MNNNTLVPKFSVIIPTLNEEKYVGLLLHSLAEQTFRDFEVIVVDGVSTDKTLTAVKRYHKHLPALSVVKSTKSLLAHQWNLGIQKARGDYLMFVHADSMLFPYFFDRVNMFIFQEKPDFFTSWFAPDSRVSGDALITLLTNLGLEVSVMIHRTVAPGSLSVVSRKACSRVGGFSEEYRFGEDADFGSRLSEVGYTLKILRETLVVCSLRRFRNEGTLRVLRTYAWATIAMIVTRRPPKAISSYLMGGALYSKLKDGRLSLLKTYEQKIRHVLRELFA